MHRAITILPFAGLLACTAAPHPKPVAHAAPKVVAPVATQSPADAIDDATEKAEAALNSGSFARAEAVATQGRMNLHVLLHYGRNTHHVSEAIFKGLARTLRDAAERDPRGQGVPSTKGSL